MKINNIHLSNFRNHQNLTIYPKPGINVIVGENGKGKTNILESIYYCSFGKSFRTSEEKDLINENSNAAYIQLNGENSKGKIKLEVETTTKGKKFILNDKKVSKMSDLNKKINVLTFYPSQVDLFKNSPSDRRTFLDILISKIDLMYLDKLKRYKTLLKERNLALKEENVNKMYVFTLTNEMVSLSREITNIRLKYIDSLNNVLSKIASKISNKNQNLKIKYLPTLEMSDKYNELLLKMYQESYEKDLILKSTSIGIHKEDFNMLLDGKNITKYGSQGENRLSVISLILSPYFLENSDHPIVILDDVLSELDEINKSRLLEFLSKFEQVFITTTNSIGIGNEIKI